LDKLQDIALVAGFTKTELSEAVTKGVLVNVKSLLHFDLTIYAAKFLFQVLLSKLILLMLGCITIVAQLDRIDPKKKQI